MLAAKKFMTQPIINVTHVGKSFPIYRSPWQALRHACWPSARIRHFTALKNINLTLYPGETLGIVGHNGAGKSTLLQIITGVMQPDQGQVQARGRVVGLLELGSGFNPEFSGRENVFFNGAILGLSRSEMTARLGRILDFAGIGDFIDQPVKHYSSGMMVRLAFAVIINTDPEVLIIDEALAVGDDAFQRKCYARLRQLQAQGTSILLVSHSAAQVIELCDRALLLDKGEVLLTDQPKTVIHQYHKLLHMEGDDKARFRDYLLTHGTGEGYASEQEPQKTAAHHHIEDTEPAPTPAALLPELQPESTIWYEAKGARLSNPRLLTAKAEQTNVLESGLRYRYCFDVAFEQEAFEVGFGMLIKTLTGIALGGATSVRNHSHRLPYVAAGSQFTVSFEFDCALRNGTYFLNCGCSALINGERDFLHRGVDVAMFQVIAEAEDSTGIIDLAPSMQVLDTVTGKVASQGVDKKRDINISTAVGADKASAADRALANQAQELSLDRD